MPLIRRSRILDIALGICIGGVVVAAVMYALRPRGRDAAGERASNARREPRQAEAGPLVALDSSPADAPLRRELERLATVQAAWYERQGAFSPSAASLAYWPVARGTVSFFVDSTGASWTGSAFDPDSQRQCAVRVGPASDPYIRRLPEGVIACRRLPHEGRASSPWGRSPVTTVWQDGRGRADRGGTAALRGLRAMQVVWLGDDEEDDGSDFIQLRDGLGREPYPDDPDSRYGLESAWVHLADATWGRLGRDARWAAVVRIVERTDDSTEDNYLAVVRARSGRLVNGAPYYIGDGTRLFRLWAARGYVAADLVARGEQDPPCCPTDTVHLRLRIVGDELEEVEAADEVVTAARGGAPPCARLRRL